MPSSPAPADAGRSRYLDGASSVPLRPEAREVLLAALDRGYGDPRRLHRQGRDARLLLDNARAVVAEVFEVHSDEVHFTASGAEAVHRGLLGLARARASAGRDGIVTSPVEHAAVRHAVDWAPSSAHRLLGVDRVGRIDPAEVARVAAGDGVAVVALQAANHEIGTRQPIDQLDLPAGVPLFVDAAAAIGHGPLPQRWQALAGSARKWGGPAGIGVLVLRRGTRWTNPFPGDDEPEVAGFGAIAGALAAAAALRATVAEQDEVGARQHALVHALRDRVASLPDVEVVGDPDDRLPHLVTFSCLYVPGDELVSALDRHGFSVASGSACTASSLEPSHVLAAIGALTHGNVRVSLASDTTADDVEEFSATVEKVLRELRRGLA